MKKIAVLAALAAFIFAGCHATRPVDNAEKQENNIVFVRPAKFTPFFGSYSVEEFVEITYQKVSRNANGMMVVEVGIRNRGPVSWTNWYVKAPELLPLQVKCQFYSGTRLDSPIVYETNRQQLSIARGTTFAYKATCPVAGANDYQLVFGD